MKNPDCPFPTTGAPYGYTWDGKNLVANPAPPNEPSQPAVEAAPVDDQSPRSTKRAGK